MAEQQHFDPSVLTKAAEDTLAVRRVFGEAYQRDGVLVVPVARVVGGLGTGAGAGEGAGVPGWHRWHHGATAEDETAAPASAATSGDGETPHGQGHGGGGGYAAYVKPLGVYVVDASGAHWEPALDVNRIVLGAQVALAVVLSFGLLARALRRH